jgi:hypothetical protein
VQSFPSGPGLGLASIDESVISLADDNRDGELAALIAKRADLDEGLVARALASERVEAAAAVCRIAGLSVNSYSAVLRMRARRSPGQSRALAVLLADYRLSAEVSPRELAKLLGNQET